MKKYRGNLAVIFQGYLQYIICNLTGFIIVWQITPCTVCQRAMTCLLHWCCWTYVLIQHTFPKNMAI